MSLPLTALAGSNSIKEIYDQQTLSDSRYYPRILLIEPTQYGLESQKHCPYEELKTAILHLNPQHLRDEIVSLGDLREPLKNWNLSPDCFHKDIHRQIETTENKVEGLAMGVIISAGETFGLVAGIELVLTKIDSETMSIALFTSQGASIGLNLIPASVGLMQGLLQGRCPDGIFSYAGGFTNAQVGFDSWSFATGDFPPLSNKLQGCSSYVKLFGLSGLSTGISQTYYTLFSPQVYKIRGPSITKLIAWLDN